MILSIYLASELRSSVPSADGDEQVKVLRDVAVGDE
jgi:hypothetical protein